MPRRRLQAGAAGLLLVSLLGCGGGAGGSRPASGATAGVASTTSAAGAVPTVTGRVLDELGAPVAGVFLVVGGPGGVEGPELDPDALLSAADGSFGLALPPGRWEVTAIDPEGRSGLGAVDVGAAPATLDLRLAPLAEQLAVDLIEQGFPEASEEGAR